MSTVRAILRSYRRPQEVLRAARASGADDATALSWLFSALGLVFVARLPGLARLSHLSDGELPLPGLMLGTFFGTLLVAPLLFYLLAALSNAIYRFWGGRTSATEARLALFWGLLASAPLVLLQGLTVAFMGPGAYVFFVSGLAFLAFVWIWIGGLCGLGQDDSGQRKQE